MADAVARTAQVTGEKQRITAEEYFAAYPETMLPMELMDGEVVMSPAPLVEHQRIAGAIYLLIASVVQANQLGEVFFAPCDVKLTENHVVQPDVFYISKDNGGCRLVEGKYWQGAPDLCVEILSSGKEAQQRDRIEKFDLYAQYGVREYWIVDPLGEFIEVYTLTEGKFDRFGAFAEGDSFTSPVLPLLTVKLDDIFPPAHQT